jgi:hypothetical protein
VGTNHNPSQPITTDHNRSPVDFEFDGVFVKHTGYRTSALKTHPDRCQEESKKDEFEAAFKDVNEACASFCSLRATICIAFVRSVACVVLPRLECSFAWANTKRCVMRLVLVLLSLHRRTPC